VSLTAKKYVVIPRAVGRLGPTSISPKLSTHYLSVVLECSHFPFYDLPTAQLTSTQYYCHDDELLVREWWFRPQLSPWLNQGVDFILEVRGCGPAVGELSLVGMSSILARVGNGGVICT
jgi:hypothetical protein